MPTRFTEITAKSIQDLQDIDSYKKAWRVLVGIRDSVGVPVLLVCHLAKYWQCDEAEIITKLR